MAIFSLLPAPPTMCIIERVNSTLDAWKPTSH